MKLAYLVEATALVAAHAKMLVEQSEQISTTSLGDYYIHSRNRFNRWMRDLNDMEKGVRIRDPLHLFGLCPRDPAIQSLTEQILINDLMNRVWTVILTAADRHRQEQRIEPLAHNVFQSHLTVRSMALRVARNSSDMTPDRLRHIQQIQASSERWSDLLNCPLMARYDLWHFAFDEARAREFHRDQFHREHLEPQNNDAWALILAGLRHSFPAKDGLASPLHDDDRMITRTIIDSFPPDTRTIAAWSRPTFERSHVF